MNPSLKRKLTALLLLSAGCFILFPDVQTLLVDAASGLSGKQLNFFFWSWALQQSGILLSVFSFVLLLTEIFTFLNERKFLLFSVSAIAMYYWVFLQQVSAVPINDDYFSVLAFSNAFNDAKTVSEKFDLLFSFHGECRLFFTHIYVMSFLKIFGHIPFGLMMLVLNLCLLLIAFLFYKRMAEDKKVFSLMISVLLLFQFSFYDAQLWLTPALHYQFTVLFVLLFLYFLEKEKVVFRFLAVIFALLAVLTFGNGFLVFPLAIFYSLLHKKWWMLGMWTAITVMTVCLYFSSYTAYSEPDDFSVLKNLAYSCCFVGGSFQFFQNMLLPFIFGLCVWIFFFYLMWKKYYLRNFFLFAIVAFVLGSSVMAGLFRIHTGVAEALSNRYGIFSVLAIISTMLIVYDLMREQLKEKFSKVAIRLAVVFYFASFIFFFPEVPQRNKILNEFSENFQNSKKYEHSPVIPPQADSIMREAVRRNIVP